VSRSGFSSKSVNLIYRTSIWTTSNFPPPAVWEYFAFYSPIRKGTDMGLPDLDLLKNVLLVIYIIIHIGNVLYTPEIAHCPPIEKHQIAQARVTPANIAMFWVDIPS